MSYYPYQQAQLVLPPPRQSSTAHVVIAWALAVFTLLYLLPWAVAATRNKNNVVAIAMINVFLGWSLIGWVAAFVMACTSNPTSPVMIINYPAPLPYALPHQGFRGYESAQPQLPAPPRQATEPTVALHRPGFDPGTGEYEATRPLPIYRDDSPDRTESWDGRPPHQR